MLIAVNSKMSFTCFSEPINSQIKFKFLTEGITSFTYGTQALKMHFKRFLVNQSVLFVLMYRMFNNFSVNVMPYLNQGVVYNIRPSPKLLSQTGT